MNVARNVMTDPRLVPGGGACEMALAHVSQGGILNGLTGLEIENNIYLLAGPIYIPAILSFDLEVQNYFQLTNSY
jgi:hypothetical protein